MHDLPANPMSIELTIAHRQLWWQPSEEDDQPESWDVWARVWAREVCPPEQRHVGKISLSVADLGRDRNLLDSIELGDWSVEFIAETVLDLAEGTLVPELDEQISEGTPRMVILSWIELAQAWRGHGLAGPLTAAALERFSRTARLAVCRISPADFMPDYPDRFAAELATVRLGGMLEQIGFFLWKGVYVIDLRDQALIDASLALLERWGPYSDQQRGSIPR